MYRYKKGVGWVSGPEYETQERTNGGYRMVLERRLPEVGERYYSMETFETLDAVFADVFQQIGAAWSLSKDDVGGLFDPAQDPEQSNMKIGEAAVIVYYGPE